MLTVKEHTLNEVRAYGYDGINLDLENVKSDYAKDFLQFVRELSVECHKNNIILSTDNYKPEAYNSCYNLKEQSDYVDYAIVMAYDEHYAGSPWKGILVDWMSCWMSRSRVMQSTAKSPVWMSSCRRFCIKC